MGGGNSGARAREAEYFAKEIWRVARNTIDPFFSFSSPPDASLAKTHVIGYTHL
jgi:hypothetical protein